MTLMTPGEYHVSLLDAPNVPDSERKDAIRWRLGDLVDYPVESACINVLDVPVDGMARQASVYAVSASENAVRKLMQLYVDAAIPLAVIDIPELAQRNVAALFEEADRGLAFLYLGEGSSCLTLTYRGELIVFRRIEISAALLADEQKRGREEVIGRLVLELQRTLDHFDRQYGQIVISKVMVASCHVIGGLISALGKHLQVPVQEANLATVMTFPMVPELANLQYQARNMMAIGTALREDEVIA